MPADRAAADRLRRVAVIAYVLAVLGLSGASLVTSLGWVNRTFPGFFLMNNRVVPSVGLDHWTGVQAGKIYQRQVVTVDGEPAASALAIYRRVAESPPGRAFHYTLRNGACCTEERTISSMRFTVSDYVSMFGALLLNGLIFTAVGIAVWMIGPGGASATGTIVLALDIGLFCLTAMDLYGPGRLFRLHVTTEALFPATLLHLMLVFPLPRLGRYRRSVLAGIYVLDLVLVALYQRYLYEPEAYSSIHNLCMTVVGMAGAGLIGSGVQAYFASPSPLVRKRLGIIALGTLTGFAIPAWVLTTSGLFGGERAINVAAFTAFLFPLSLAYAVVKHDLFEIDAMLRRGIGYLALTAAVVAIYTVLVLGSGFVLQTKGLAQSPAFPVVFSLLMVLLFNPMRDRIQRGVDRLYHRTTYNAQKTLERASSELVATLDLDRIYRLTIDTICQALVIEEASLWMKNGTGQLTAVYGPGVVRFSGITFGEDHPLIARLSRCERAVSAYDFVDRPTTGPDAEVCERALRTLRAELVLPLGMGDLIGCIALGRKQSATLFTLDDLDFLTTLANQAAVAIRNAQRTHELGLTNQELANSLRELEHAYDELQRSQENLVRAEKMAALGKLTAGIAHEVNTPLGASLNSLKIAAELTREYAGSIGDRDVNEDDHREMAGELEELIGNVTKWTSKAASYIRSIKTHTRSLEGVQETCFDVAQLIEDMRPLLAHHLKRSLCTMTVDCPKEVTLYGDPGKLGQVLTNLVTNAIDAYDGRTATDGIIRIRVLSCPWHVEIVVEDEGCGIPAEHLERIFEELFTTKPQGIGTGLGLAISRNIVLDCFGGRIDVASTPGKGSRFTLTIPRREAQAHEGRRAAAEARLGRVTAEGGYEGR